MAGAVRPCSSCEKPLGRGTRGTLCRACKYPPRPDRFCAGCGKKIDAAQNESGYCRRCNCLRNHAGEANERRIEGLRRSAIDPVIRKKRGEAVRRYTHTPEGRRQRAETARKVWRLTVGSSLCVERGHTREARLKGWETRRRRQRERATLIRFYQHDAADFLRKFSPIYRCNERGRADVGEGAKRFWRYGNVILTPDELMQRAAAKGWVAA